MERRAVGVAVNLKCEVVQGMPLIIPQVADNGRCGARCGMGSGRTDTCSRLENIKNYLEGRGMEGIQERRRIM
jgi:hypothetical protein